MLATAGGGFLLLRVAAGDSSERASLSAPRLLSVAVWLAALGILEWFAFGAFGWSLFGWIHLAYLDLLLVLPALALFTFALGRARGPGSRTRGATILAVLGLVPLPLLCYATFVEPFDLRFEETTVPLVEERAGTDALRIGVLSDVQSRKVTDHERAAVRLLMDAAPDLILIPGDVIHATNFRDYDAALPEFRALLSELHAPGGVFLVQGNTDPLGRLDELVRGTDVELLRNAVVHRSLGDRRFALGGLDLDDHVAPEGRAVITALELPDDPGELRILLTHRPDALWKLRHDSRIDLLVSGHTHGGQVSVPFFGPPITLSSVPRDVAAGGLHVVDGRRIYVSRGVGLERGTAPRIRFRVPPEVSLLTLK